jgi:hypothetical protein
LRCWLRSTLTVTVSSRRKISTPAPTRCVSECGSRRCCNRAPARASATLEPGYVALTAHFSCPPGELTQEFRWLMVLPSNYRVVMGDQSADANLRTLHVQRPEWTTVKLVSFTLGWRLWVAVGAAGLAALAAALRRRRFALAFAGLALFALGFWLVERLVA